MFFIDKIIETYLHNDDILLKQDIIDYDVTNICKKMMVDNNDIFHFNLNQKGITSFYEYELEYNNRICLQYTCYNIENVDEIKNVSPLMLEELSSRNEKIIFDYLLNKEYKFDLDNIKTNVCFSIYIEKNETVNCVDTIYSYLDNNGHLNSEYLIPVNIKKYDEIFMKKYVKNLFVSLIYPILFSIDFMNKNEYRYKTFFGDKRNIYKILV